MVMIMLKMTKQSEVALFRNILCKTTNLPDFTLITHMCTHIYHNINHMSILLFLVQYSSINQLDFHTIYMF